MSAASPPARRAHHLSAIACFVVVASFCTRTFVTTEFGLSVINQWLLYSVAAIGFYLVFCVAGRFAFCQTFMMATGAYTAAYVARTYGFWAGILVGVAVVAIVAAVFGILVRKTEAFYFAIATLALSQLGAALFIRWTEFTGPSGLASNVPLPEPLGSSLASQADMYWLLLAGVVAALLVTVYVERSPLARDAIAARDIPELAASSGVPVERVQVVLFVVGSALGGLSGALTAYWQGSVSTESFGITLAIGIFLMPIIGGVGSMWGPVAGALLYVGLPQVLSGLDEYASIFYGVALVVAIIALPDGIIGAARRTRDRLADLGSAGDEDRGEADSGHGATRWLDALR